MIIFWSSLRSIIEKPPITGKELSLLTGGQLTGFRLHPGPVSNDTPSENRNVLCLQLVIFKLKFKQNIIGVDGTFYFFTLTFTIRQIAVKGFLGCLFFQLPEQYRLMTQVPVKRKHKHKKHKKEPGKEGIVPETEGAFNAGLFLSFSPLQQMKYPPWSWIFTVQRTCSCKMCSVLLLEKALEPHDHKKRKAERSEKEKEKKKRKKEKKKKKEKDKEDKGIFSLSDLWNWVSGFSGLFLQTFVLFSFFFRKKFHQTFFVSINFSVMESCPLFQVHSRRFCPSGIRGLKWSDATQTRRPEKSQHKARNF